MATIKRRRIAPGVYELERGVYELVVSRGARPDGKYRQKTKRNWRAGSNSDLSAWAAQC